MANGAIFSFLIFTKKENQPANRFLSLMILSMCFTFTPYMLDPIVWHTFRWLVWMPFSLSYWIGPAFYFYIRALTTPNFKFVKAHWWHFFPIVLNYLHSIYHGTLGDSNPYPGFHHVAEILESAAIVSVILYMWLAYQLVKAYQRSLLDRVSNLDHIDLKWINRLVLVVAGVFMLILAFLIISSGLMGKDKLYQWDRLRAGTLVVYATILYWLSISGFRQGQTITISGALSKEHKDHKPTSILLKLNQLMTQEHAYRNSDLNLSDLSKAANVSERAVSEAINQELGKNFYQFVNEYRIDEVKARLKDPNCQHLKIISLALDAGFNSKASFNRVFKQYTGNTPQQYKSQN